MNWSKKWRGTSPKHILMAITLSTLQMQTQHLPQMGYCFTDLVWPWKTSRWLNSANGHSKSIRWKEVGLQACGWGTWKIYWPFSTWILHLQNSVTRKPHGLVTFRSSQQELHQDCSWPHMVVTMQKAITTMMWVTLSFIWRENRWSLMQAGVIIRPALSPIVVMNFGLPSPHTTIFLSSTDKANPQEGILMQKK